MAEDAKNSDLIKATKKKLEKFNKIRGRQVKAGEFWDLVVITAVDETQRAAYELLLREKMNRQELPTGINYHVFADPPGPKIGNGGSTLHTLQLLTDQYGEALSEFKVILIHAGGFSQRLPNASALGKIFIALPLGEPLYQMLELKLAMYIDFPSNMKPGMLVTCADDLELYCVSKQVTFNRPGFTALAHPSPLSIGTTHGVFVLKTAGDSELSDAEYRTCFCFLHKPSMERMRCSEAVCRGGSNGEFVYTDSTYYIDYSTTVTLLDLFKDISPLQCEIDAYGDFLQGLGPGATAEYTTNTANINKDENNLVKVRGLIFQRLKGMPLNVILLNNSKFYHLGTTEEYLFHFTLDPHLRAELGLQTVAFSLYEMEASQKTSACVVHSIFNPDSSVCAGSVVEYSKVEAGVSVGTRSIISGCWVGPGLSVPDQTFLHSLSVSVGGKMGFVTVAFGIRDDLKKSVSGPANMNCLRMFGIPLEECVSLWGLTAEDVRFSGDGNVCSLWNCCLFPVCDDMKSCFAATLEIVHAAYASRKAELPRHGKLLSMQEILHHKDLEPMLKFRKSLYEDILQAKGTVLPVAS